MTSAAAALAPLEALPVLPRFWSRPMLPSVSVLSTAFRSRLDTRFLPAAAAVGGLAAVVARVELVAAAAVGERETAAVAAATVASAAVAASVEQVEVRVSF